MSDNPFSIPLDQTIAIDLSKAKFVKPDGEAADKWAEIFRQNLERMKGQSAEEREAQIARQRAQEVETVYRVNGKVVAMDVHGAGSTFASNADGQFSVQAYHQGQSYGLSGDQLEEFVSRAVLDAMKSKYGGALSVTKYEAGSGGPNAGQIEDEMFGRTTVAQSSALPDKLNPGGLARFYSSSFVQFAG